MNMYNTDNYNININFSLFPFCFRCVSVGKFTNKLKDSDQFFKYFKRMIEDSIPYFSQYTFENITQNTQRHSHAILTNTKEYALVINIIKELYKSYKADNYSDRDFEIFLFNNINDYHIWQLGVSGGVRLFGVRKSNIFYVLFIDYHHLIYADKNYNTENYELYDFCPMTNNKKGGINDEF